MSVLKSKSSIGLIIGIILILLLIPIWYTMLAPSIVASEIEKIDMTTSFKGTLKSDYPTLMVGVTAEVTPVNITAYLHVEAVKGDNVILKIDVEGTNSTGYVLPDLSQNSTYVLNKFTRENVPDAPEADKNRTGYDPLYPSHLKKGENITAWFDNPFVLNITGTLEFKESIVEEGVTLYKYSGSKEITGVTYTIFKGLTLNLSRTVLVEPLSGLPAYTENEVLHLYKLESGVESTIIKLTYGSTNEAKAQGIADAKAAYDGMQLLELYLPMILGVVAIILVIGLAFNVRRLKRKMAPSASKPAKPSPK